MIQNIVQKNISLDSYMDLAVKIQDGHVYSNN